MGPIRRFAFAIFRRTKASLLQRAAKSIGNIDSTTFGEIVKWCKEAEQFMEDASNDEKREAVRKMIRSGLKIVVEDALTSVLIALAVGYMKMGGDQ